MKKPSFNPVTVPAASLALLVVLLLGWLPCQAFAQNSQKLLDTGSRSYGYLEAIFLEQGLAMPNNAKPWSLEELGLELGRIDPSTLSAAGSKAYGYLLSLLAFPEPTPALQSSIGAVLSPEVFTRVQLAGDNSPDPDGYPWLHGYEDRQALLEFPLEFWLGDGFYSSSVFAAKEEHATVREPGNYSNLLLDDPNVRLDLYFPFQAYASLGGLGWSLRFGRDALSWGNGHSGNLVLSDYSDFYDYLGLTLYGDRIKFNSVYAVFDPFDPQEPHERVAYSALMGHRLDIVLHRRLRLSLNEVVSFGGDFQPDLVRDLNTFMVFHNWMIPERSNSLMAIELDYTPWRWFSVYGQFAMDEFATKYEEERSGGGGPPVMAYLTGLSGYYPVGEAYLGFGLEGVLTSPWLYNRRKAPYFYNVRRYWSLANDQSEYIIKPIGYRYGPDAVVINAHASWDLPDGPEASLELTWVARGDKTIDTLWLAETGDSAPSGDTPENSLRVQLKGSYPLSRRLEAGAGLALNSRWNIGHAAGSDSTDLELNLFVKARF